jgi:Ca2+-binding EF-hand superfamily protein
MPNASSLIAVAATSMLLALPAAGQVRVPGTSRPELEQQFRAADLNHDGELSRDEARRAKLSYSEQFDDLDADHNGLVTLFEFGSAIRTSMNRWMADWDKADTDHDGKLSPSELRAAPPSIKKIFQTGDGSAYPEVSRDQYESSVQRRLHDSTDLPSVAPNIIEKRF